MQSTLSSIQSLYHFEPLSELALMRYSINAEGRIEFLDGKRGETDVEFVVDLMGLYSGSTAFDQTKFQAHSLATVMEYLERTHTFYENVLLPKMEIAIYGILKLFPDHVIADVLNAFLVHTKTT